MFMDASANWSLNIANILKAAFENDDSVHALWLEGSVAQGCQDEMSDLDVWISIDTGTNEIVLNKIRTQLEKLGTLDIDYQMPQHHKELSHQVFHLENTPACHTVDINLQDITRDVTLTESVDDYMVVFDKSGVIKSATPHDGDIDFVNVRQKALQYYKLQKPNITKNLNREQPLEALVYYRYLVEYIIKMERLKTTPFKNEYDLKHIYRDLDRGFVKFIESLLFINQKSLTKALDDIKAYIDKYI